MQVVPLLLWVVEIAAVEVQMIFADLEHEKVFGIELA